MRATRTAASQSAPETGEELLARILTERRNNWHGRGRYEDPGPPEDANLPSLPNGWIWTRLEQLGFMFGGLTKNPKRAKLPKQLPYLRVANVYANELRLQEIEHIGVEDSELPKLLVRAGDLLIVEGNGSKDQIGRLAIWDGSIAPCVHQNHLIKVRPVQSGMPKWILHWLQSPSGRHFVELVASSTSGLYTLSVNKVSDLPIPLAPLPDQQRIVPEIEKQFTRLEAGVAALRRVQANLKRYRAAVLKAACEGRLVPTEAKLAKTGKRKSTFATGEALLARILTERRNNWQGRGKYKEPSSAATKNLPPVPTTWAVASLEQMTSAVRPICYGILMPKENVAHGVLFVKVKDMKSDRIDLDSLHRTAPEIAAKYSRASLRTGDLLLSIRGTYGRVAEVPKELDGGNITQDTARLDVTGQADHRYVATCLRNPDCQDYFKRVSRGVAVKGVNIGDVRLTPVPLPSLAEQTRIVAEVERRLSVVEELEAVVSANLQRATRLRQSILQKAFTGGL